MPGRENVTCRVDIAIVGDTTPTARPFSYFKSCDTFRPRFGQAATTRTGSSIGQTKLNTNTVLVFDWLNLHINHYIKVPAATGIFVEATRAEFILAQAVAVPHLEVVAIMVDLPVFPLSCTGIDGYPAQ